MKSKIKKLKIDPEFKSLLSPLKEHEYSLLEKSILGEGCRNPIVVWKEKGVILDGHQRYEICEKHNVEFKTTEIELKSRDDARVWIVMNQLNRKNLDNLEEAKVAFKILSLEAEESIQKMKAK